MFTLPRVLSPRIYLVTLGRPVILTAPVLTGVNKGVGAQHSVAVRRSARNLPRNWQRCGFLNPLEQATNQITCVYVLRFDRYFEE